MALKTLRQLTEDLKPLVDDADLLPIYVTSLFNEALGDLTPVLRLEARATAQVLAGRAEYAAPLDMYEPRYLKIQEEPASRERLVIEDTISKGYKLWAGAIILQPAPQTDGTLELWYYRIPAALANDGDKPEVPEPYQHALLWYAGARYQVDSRDIEIERATFWPKYLMVKSAIDLFTAKRAAKGAPRQFKVSRGA